MTTQDRKTEELIAKAFQTMLEKIIQTETKWNGEIIKGIAQQSKWIGVTSASITTSKEKTKQSRLAIKEIDKEIEAKRLATEENKKLIKFRSVFNIAREKEHGAQVRRNKELQHQLNNTGSGLQFLTNSIKGRFGFQSALGNITKSLMNGIASFDELQKNTEMLADAQKRLDDINKQVFPDKDEKKAAEDEVKGLETEKINIKNRGIGTGETTKPLFNVLSKVGKFMEKKALPIGIGIGVAGILMSVIVKSFSASPLFAQMMKMMKFAVTLILMPIGTFFGAILRPILITLLRKFIVPMYSTWMPIAMKVGGQVGNWLSALGFGGDLLEKAGHANILPTEEELRTEAAINGVDVDLAQVVWNNFWNEIWKQSTIKTKPSTLSGLGLGIGTGGVDTGEEDKKETPEEELARIRAEEERVAAELAKELSSLEEDKVVETHDQEAIDLFAQSVAESEKISKALEAEAEAGRAPTLEEVIEEMEKIAGARDSLSDESNAILAEVDKYKEQTINKLPEIIIPAAIQTYAEKQAEKNASYGNMGIDRGDPNNRGEDGSSVVGGLGEFAGKTWQDYIPAANGFSGMVNKPTMFLAGEAGSEHVDITPSGGSSGGGITVNIGTMNGSDNDLRKLKQTILEVIQQSSANRGRL